MWVANLSKEPFRYVVARVVLDISNWLDLAPGPQVPSGHVRVDPQDAALEQFLPDAGGLGQYVVLTTEGIRALLPSPNRDDSSAIVPTSHPRVE